MMLQTAPPLPPMPPAPDDPISIAIALVIVLSTAGGLGMLFMLVRAWSRRIAGTRAAPAEATDVAELRESVGRLSGELAELQERMDFAERLLTQQREAERLRGGAG